MTTNTASRNPFASRHIDALRFQSPGLELRSLCDRLERLGGRAAIVGPHGSGKTTLMAQIADTLVESGWRINAFRTTTDHRGQRDWMGRNFASEDAVLIDGAGHLGPLGRRRLLRATRRAGRLILTAHRPLALPTLHRCKPSLTLLDALVSELATHRAEELRPVSHRLYATHGGNIRDVLRGLYDHCAGLS